jgi:hypothetical protein
VFSFVPRCQGLCGSQKIDLHIGSYRKVLVSGHLQSAIPRQRAPQGGGELTNVPTHAVTTTAVSLLGTLISVAKRE